MGRIKERLGGCKERLISSAVNARTTRVKRRPLPVMIDNDRCADRRPDQAKAPSSFLLEPMHAETLRSSSDAASFDLAGFPSAQVSRRFTSRQPVYSPAKVFTLLSPFCNGAIRAVENAAIVSTPQLYILKPDDCYSAGLTICGLDTETFAGTFACQCKDTLRKSLGQHHVRMSPSTAAGSVCSRRVR